MIKEAVGYNIKYLCKCADYKDPLYTKAAVFIGDVFLKRIIQKSLQQYSVILRQMLSLDRLVFIIQKNLILLKISLGLI